MSRRKRRATNKKEATGCLIGSFCIITGSITAVIGYNTWRGLWLLFGIILASVGLFIDDNDDNDDNDDGIDDMWWLD